MSQHHPFQQILPSENQNQPFVAAEIRAILKPRAFEEIYFERAYIFRSMKAQSERITALLQNYIEIEYISENTEDRKLRRQLRKRMSHIRSKMLETNSQHAILNARLGELYIELSSREVWNARWVDQTMETIIRPFSTPISISTINNPLDASASEFVTAESQEHDKQTSLCSSIYTTPDINDQKSNPIKEKRLSLQSLSQDGLTLEGQDATTQVTRRWSLPHIPLHFPHG